MNRTNTFLAVLLVIVVVMTAAVGVDYSKPNIEILPDMKYTPAWKAFAANPNFPNGRTMQPPVGGTIARGQLPLHFAATKEDAVRAGEELQNPVSRSAIEAAVDAESEAVEATVETPGEAAATEVAPAEVVAPAPDVAQQNEAARRAAIVDERFAASVERGSKVYLTYCNACHGPKGAGDGLVPQRGFPPPPSMLTGKSLQMKDGQLFHILTYGQGSMAPFAAQLSRDLRWDVINYVRDLQSNAPAVPEAEPAATEATPEASTDKTNPQTKAESEKTGESAPTSNKPDAQKEPDVQKQPAVEPDKGSAKKPDAETTNEESKLPPNELRESAAGDEKKPAAPTPQVPGDEPEPTTDAES